MSPREWVMGIALAAISLPFAAWLLRIGVADMLTRRASPERAAELDRLEAWALRRQRDLQTAADWDPTLCAIASAAATARTREPAQNAAASRPSQSTS